MLVGAFHSIIVKITWFGYLVIGRNVRLSGLIIIFN